MSNGRAGEAPATLDAIISATAARHGDRPAIIAEEKWSFGRLSAEADSVARALGRLGVRRGDRVALKLAPSGRALVLLAAIAKTGASAVPFDISTPAARLRSLTADAGVRLTVDGASQLADLFGHAPAGPRPEGARPGGEAYVIYTSGSTGTPKGVAVSHAAIAAHARHAAGYFGLSPMDRVLQFASLGFDVSQEEIWPSWAAGAAVAVNPVWLPDAHQLGEIVAEREATVLQLPTAYWRTLIAERGPAAAAFSGVRLVVVGGEAARGSDLRAHASSALGHAELVNGYGPTETVVTSVAWRFPPGARLPEERPVPIGAAFPGREVAVVTASGELAGPGQDGELWVAGLLADGYVNRPDLTRSRFVSGAGAAPLPPGPRWYKTGDRVLVLPGRELAFAGRLDDQVKLRGYRIELGEIDAGLRESGLVCDAATALIERDDAEPRIGALIIPKDRFDPRSLVAALRDRLPAAFVPALWAQAPNIPLTASGKVDRTAAGHLISAAAHDLAPAASAGDSAPMLDVLGDVWREVLGTEEAAPDSDFFGLGGDSLLAVRFTARARARGVVVTPADVVRKGTLGAIAAAAQWQVAAAPGAAARTAARITLLPAQYRWLLDGPVADIHHFLVSALLRIRPETPDEALLDVASALLTQHTVLSSAFDMAKPDVGRANRGAADVVSVIDIAGPAALRETALAIKSSLDPAAGDVFRMVRLRAGEVHWLLILVHHLVLDGWSMALLVDEVEAALARRLRAGRAVLDQPSAPVAAIRAAIDAYLASDQARRDARAWLDAPWPDLAPPRRQRPGDGLLSSVMTSRSAIPSADTARILHRLPASGRPVDLLRSSIFVAMAEWTGDRTMAIDVYDNHRAAPVGGVDVSRTIGYLQSTHPEIGVVRGGGTRAVARLLAAPRFAPANLFSFDALRFLSPLASERDALSGLPRSNLRLNYRSQLSRLEQRGDNSPLTDADEDTGPDRARTQNERYDLMFEGDIIDGEFVVGAKFSTDHFTEAAVDALTRRIAELMASAAGEMAS